MLLLSLPASATPLTYFFDSGFVDVTVFRTSAPGVFLLDEQLALDGDFFEFDTSPVEIPDFRITLPTSASLALSSTYGGIDEFIIVSAVLTPGTLYSSSGSSVGPSEYTVSGGPIQVDSVYQPTVPLGSDIDLDFENPSLNATVNTDLMMFTLDGITLGVLDGSQFGESDNLVIKGDITFFGQIPEPGTGALLGLGLVAMAGLRGRRPVRRAR